MKWLLASFVLLALLAVPASADDQHCQEFPVKNTGGVIDSNTIVFCLNHDSNYGEVGDVVGVDAQLHVATSLAATLDIEVDTPVGCTASQPYATSTTSSAAKTYSMAFNLTTTDTTCEVWVHAEVLGADTSVVMHSHFAMSTVCLCQTSQDVRGNYQAVTTLIWVAGLVWCLLNAKLLAGGIATMGAFVSFIPGMPTWMQPAVAALFVIALWLEATLKDRIYQRFLSGESQRRNPE